MLRYIFRINILPTSMLSFFYVVGVSLNELLYKVKFTGFIGKYSTPSTEHTSAA